MKRSLTDEIHIVREGVETPVELSAFGWYVAATLGGSVGLIAVSLALYSMRSFL